MLKYINLNTSHHFMMTSSSLIPPVSATTARGFTLIELLAVITILSMLVALLVPVTGRILESSRTVKCLSNLKQMGVAIELFAQDNHGELPYGKTFGSRSVWTDAIASYSGGNEGTWRTPIGVMECPSAGRDGRPLIWGKGYAMNDNPGYPDVVPESWKRNWEEPWCARSGESSPRRFKMLTITHPSRRFLIGDGLTWDIGVDDLPATFSEESIGTSNHAAVNRHGKERSNVLFFDGHAASLTPLQVYYSIVDPTQDY